MVSHKKITEKDNWSWNFEDLPVYEKGEKITYTIKKKIQLKIMKQN